VEGLEIGADFKGAIGYDLPEDAGGVKDIRYRVVLSGHASGVRL